MKISLSLMGLLYVIIMGGLCYILPIASLTKVILALPSLLIVPHLVGKTVLLMLKKSHSMEFNFDVVSNFFINWCTGLIFIVSIVYFLDYFGLFDAHLFVLFIVLLMIPSVFYKCRQCSLKSFIENYGGKFPILLSPLIGVIMSLFITNFSPYPYTHAVDFIGWNYWSLKLINDNLLVFSDGYLFTHSILNSISILIFNLKDNSLKLWWASRFILYPLYSFGLYLFSYEISKIKSLSLIAAFVGTFIVYAGNESFMFLYHTAPKTIVFLLFPLFLFLVHKIIVKELKITEIENKRHILMAVLISLFFAIESIILFFNTEISEFIGVVLFLFIVTILVTLRHLRNDERSIFFLTVCIITVLLFFHVIHGFFASFFILMYLFILVFIKRQPTLSIFLTYSVVIFSSLLFILQAKEIIGYKISLIEIDQLVVNRLLDFESIWRMVNEIYPPIVLYLFFIGVIFAFFYDKYKYLPLIFLASIIFIAFISPIEYMYRLLMYLHPFIAFFCAYSLSKFYKLFYFGNTKISKIKLILITLAVVIIILSSVLNSITEINKVTSREQTEGYFTLHGVSRFRAFEYVKSNTSKNTIVLSNPWSADFYAYYSENQRPYKILSIRDNVTPNYKLLLEMFLIEDAKETYEKINMLINNRSFTCYNYDFKPGRCEQQVQNLSAIIIIDRETIKWLEESTNNSFKPNMNKFYKGEYFTLLYEDEENGIYIFGVNQ